MATTTHIQSRGSRRRIPLLLSLVAVAAVSGATVKIPTGAARPVGQAYHWPVKPFNRAHPVRGNFGDPRTTFDDTPSTRAVMTGRGNFHTHEGVDIAVPDGTAVYAVRSGVAEFRSREAVKVTSPDGKRFEYWHIVPAVRDGQQVTAFRTVLGHVRKGYEHVHVTEYGEAGPVNPLAPGHLSPYADRTKPHVTSVSFVTPRGANLLPELVDGTATLVAGAYDMPALRVRGDWRDLPVAPALLTWKVMRMTDGKMVVPTTVAFDVRSQLPGRPFWATYVRGTRQNMCPFGGTRAYFQPGVYLYRLGSLDTERFDDGVYELRVTARDTRGNTGSLRQIFSIRNHGSWPHR